MSVEKAEDNLHSLRRGPAPLSLIVGTAMARRANGGAADGEIEAMLAGIRAYQNHPYRRTPPVYTTVWRQGELRLLRRGRAAHGGKPLLLVPSPINGSAILDLLPDRSFMRAMEAQGFDPLLLDWGHLADDPGVADMDALVCNGLVAAIRAAAGYSGQAPDIAGYCMGGLLAFAACCVAPDSCGRLVMMAAPWDFHAGDRHLLNLVTAMSASAFATIAQRGRLPAAWIQGLFATLNAERVAKKFAHFAALDPASAEAELFVTTEDWLNEGADLPGAFARECLMDWYGENRPARGRWTIGGVTVGPGSFTGDALIVAARNDRLVPQDSSLALAARLPRATVLTPEPGHIGMMTGRRAQADVWEKIAAYLNSRP